MTSGDEILSQDDGLRHFNGPVARWLLAYPAGRETPKSIQWELYDGRKPWLAKNGHLWVEHPEHRGHFIVAYDDWNAKKEDLPRTGGYRPGPPAEMPPRYTPSIHRMFASDFSDAVLQRTLSGFWFPTTQASAKTADGPSSGGDRNASLARGKEGTHLPAARPS
jgi:hypothetical protein